MDIKQSINTTVFNTTKRKCAIEVSCGETMFSLKIGTFKRDNGSTQNASEHWFYMDEIDDLIKALIVCRDKQKNSKIITEVNMDKSLKICEDCGISTGDLISKSDHHGGMKTVCCDRVACNNRG